MLAMSGIFSVLRCQVKCVSPCSLLPGLKHQLTDLAEDSRNEDVRNEKKFRQLAEGLGLEYIHTNKTNGTHF